MATKYTKHPSVYITETGDPALTVFADFFREEGLPKYELNPDGTPKKKEDKNVNKFFTSEDMSNTRPETEPHNSGSKYALVGGKIVPRSLDASPRWARDTYLTHAAKCEEEAQKILKERDERGKKGLLARAMSAVFGKKAEEDVDALVTFDQVKQSVLRQLPSTADLEKACNDTIRVIEWLKSTGQYGQAEHLIDVAGVVAAELVLMKNGYGKFITQEELINFLLKCERGVRLDFLRYYGDILPVEVANKVQEANKLLVFDNYAVLYYAAKTPKFMKQKQADAVERKRRDPILFGMIEGSRRLYYITDWVTTNDDLTLASLEKILGRTMPELESSSVYNSSLDTRRLAKLAEDLERKWIEQNDGGPSPQSLHLV